MQKLILIPTLLISAISLLLLPCAPAQAQTFTKKKVATSGTAKCAVSKGKWTPVKKQGSVFVIKTNASNAEKKSCKSLLLPSKKFSLDDIPSFGGIAKAKGSVSSLDVSGTPPQLKDIQTLGAQNVFWKAGVIADINSGAPTADSCNQFFGQVDGKSSGYAGCYMAQSVAQGFSNILETTSSLCYMQSMPTQALVDAGAVTLVSGSLPGGDITKLFEVPSGSTSRLVKIATGQQDIFIQVASESANAAKSLQYSYTINFCESNAVAGSESTQISLGGKFTANTNHTFGDSGRSAISVTANLKKANSIYEFDSATLRSATFVGISGDHTFAARLEISPNNEITSRFRDSSAMSVVKGYSISHFSGSSMADLRFLEGGAKNEFNGQSFDGATEYRAIESPVSDSFYASTPDSAYAAKVSSFDFSADDFYTVLPTVNNPDEFSCSTTPDIAISLAFQNQAFQSVATKCDGEKLNGTDFCQSTALLQANAQFAAACSGPG